MYPQRFFVFHPRFWIGFGLYIGMAVPYPLTYGRPTYVYPDVYPPGAVIAPDAYGGLSFDITPADADVSVDGVYVGVAADFSPNHQPLTVTPGRHHVELQAPGEVVPFEGSLTY